MAAAMVTAAARAQEQPGRDACVEKLRQTGGPDAQNGIEVLDTQWSQAGTLVTMRDAGGTVWECLGYEDGAAEMPTVVDAADDGGGAMAVNPAREGPENDGETTTVQVRFSAGASGATYDGSLTRGSSTRYVLGARDGQFLDVQVSPGGAGISYQIFNPDQSFLLDMIDADKPYRGQLFQSGDHMVEVINRGDATTSYRVVFGIE
jgi:hypothetical protein